VLHFPYCVRCRVESLGFKFIGVAFSLLPPRPLPRGGRRIASANHVTCMYPPPHMTCMWPAHSYCYGTTEVPLQLSLCVCVCEQFKVGLFWLCVRSLLALFPSPVRHLAHVHVHACMRACVHCYSSWLGVVAARRWMPKRVNIRHACILLLI
jgi:hypothetical protein